MMKEPSKAPLFFLFILLVATSFWWLLAFLPLSTTSPEWLVAARVACFGIDSEGALPDAGGWVMLIGAPLLMFAALFVAWGADLREATKMLIKRPVGWGVMVLIMICVVIQGFWVGERIQSAQRVASLEFTSDLKGDFPENYVRRNLPAYSFELTNQKLDYINLSELTASGKTVILSFAFAHCRTICPAIVKQVGDASREFEDDEVSVLIVTLDPRRDTPSSLAGWAERWELPPNTHLLSGSVEDVERVLQNYGMLFEPDEKTGDVEHPALTHVIAPDGRIIYSLGNAPSQWIVQATRRVVEMTNPAGGLDDNLDDGLNVAVEWGNSQSKVQPVNGSSFARANKS